MHNDADYCYDDDSYITTLMSKVRTIGVDAYNIIILYMYYSSPLSYIAYLLTCIFNKIPPCLYASTHMQTFELKLTDSKLTGNSVKIHAENALFPHRTTSNTDVPLT